MQPYFEQWRDEIIAAIPTILTALAIFLVSIYAARLLSRVLTRIMERRRTQASVANLIVQVTRWALITVGVIAALQQFFNVTAFLTGLGIIGFTVGFALQDVMKNFAAGMILLLQEPFEVGDTISVADFDGTITTIDLRTTEMKTLDGRIVILPNATILSSPIINYTRAERRRVELPIAVSYDADPGTTRRIILDAIQGVQGFVTEPPPTVFFQAFSGPAIDLTAYFWIDTAHTNPPAAKDAALTRIKAGLQGQGIRVHKV